MLCTDNAVRIEMVCTVQDKPGFLKKPGLFVFSEIILTLSLFHTNIKIMQLTPKQLENISKIFINIGTLSFGARKRKP